MHAQNRRVRNPFQMIPAVLARRSRKGASEQVRGDYAEVRERVAATGLAQDLLSTERKQSVLGAATYPDALCPGLLPRPTLPIPSGDLIWPRVAKPPAPLHDRAEATALPRRPDANRLRSGRAPRPRSGRRQWPPSAPGHLAGRARHA
ncbi:histidine kinase dimerization/phosphoacceptor domain -containing protein [Teichococcus coralli]